MLFVQGEGTLTKETFSNKERYVFILNAVWECALNPAKYQVEG